jgi:hypothetical protein
MSEQDVEVQQVLTDTCVAILKADKNVTYGEYKKIQEKTESDVVKPARFYYIKQQIYGKTPRSEKKEVSENNTKTESPSKPARPQSVSPVSATASGKNKPGKTKKKDVVKSEFNGLRIQGKKENVLAMLSNLDGHTEDILIKFI